MATLITEMIGNEPFTRTDIKPLQPFRLGKDKFIMHQPSAHLPIRYHGPPIFVTVMWVLDKRAVTADWLQAILNQYRSSDDVFRDDFLSGVLFTCTGSEHVQINHDARKLLESLGTSWIFYCHQTEDIAPLKPGPYVASDQQLFEIWKLYDDTHRAFVHALIPGPESDPSELHIGGDYPQTTSVAVPSRLYSQAFDEGPVSGWRIAVKDIFHIKGIRTSVCNNAYHELYPPSSKTAACVELLYEAGAIILGTTKLASFAATEEPVECIDFQAPWNPRGDGYQSPAGSSSGSGAAIAAYPWLDISIGSDTSGSGRRPGHWNGCFAMRPTHGTLPTEGYIPSFRRFDVPTFFGRDLDKCRQFATHWYGKNLPPNGASLPPAIIYSSDYMSVISNTEQIAIVDSFVADLEASLDVKQEKISFSELWETHPPPEAGGMSHDEYMKDVCRNSFFHDDYHSFDQFRADYYREYSKAPYVSPPVRWQWELSSKISKADRDIAMDRLEVYRRWFSSTVMRVGERHSLVIIPIEEISPRYRDEAPAKHFNPVGVPNLFLSPILGAPELTVPAGQYSYLSKVSGETERLPVAVSIIASPGRDLELFDTAHDCLTRAGRCTSVITGREMFPPHT